MVMSLCRKLMPAPFVLCYQRWKFLILSLALIGISLLTMLAPVPSLAVKPLTLDAPKLVQFTAKVSLIYFR